MKRNKFIKVLSATALSALLLFLMPSCKSAEHTLGIFEDLNDSEQGMLQTLEHTNVIMPECELRIIVSAESSEASTQFNLPATKTLQLNTALLQESPQIQTYEVDPDGNILLPVIGSVHVGGLTVNEARQLITEKVSEYITNPIVTVTLMGYLISVIGEVNEPKAFYTSADRFNILDALANCGDLTEYARRDNIMVIRRTADNKTEYGKLNLRSSKATQSPYFWLQHNDIVIVAPNDIKQDNSKYNQYSSYNLSVISTVVSACSIIASLIIALVN